MKTPQLNPVLATLASCAKYLVFANISGGAAQS